jgi:hypothetical protein
MLIYPEAFTRFLSSALCLSFIAVLELIISRKEGDLLYLIKLLIR